MKFYHASIREEFDNFDRFGEDFPDGRLVEPSSPEVFSLKEAILLSKKTRSSADG